MVYHLIKFIENRKKNNNGVKVLKKMTKANLGWGHYLE